MLGLTVRRLAARDALLRENRRVMTNTTSNQRDLSRRSVLTVAGLALLGIATGRPASAKSSIEAGVSLEPLFGARTWLNGQPSRTSLDGRVVLVDVFTFDCINCKNITPNLRELERSRSGEGLTIVGIHSPETSYERGQDAVVEHLRTLGVTWPVAIDNDFALWKAFHNAFWPTQYLFDRRGTLRKVVVGDSQDAIVNSTIKRLLAERS